METNKKKVSKTFLLLRKEKTNGLKKILPWDQLQIEKFQITFSKILIKQNQKLKMNFLLYSGVNFAKTKLIT